jgi:hypothetical protein
MVHFGRGGLMHPTALALAFFAVAFEEDFGDVEGRCFRAFGGTDFDLHVGEAGDGAAIDADEVGVFAGGVLAGGGFGLESPGVVAGVEAGGRPASASSTRQR